MISTRRLPIARSFACVAPWVAIVACACRTDEATPAAPTARSAPVSAPVAPPATSLAAKVPSVAPVLDEAQKIERLLARMQASTDTFVRSGANVDGVKAAEHLRTKWKFAGDRIASARAFIDEIGTRSSTSGKPYLVRDAEGHERELRAWLNDALAEVEGASKP